MGQRMKAGCCGIETSERRALIALGTLVDPIRHSESAGQLQYSAQRYAIVAAMPRVVRTAWRRPQVLTMARDVRPASVGAVAFSLLFIGKITSSV